MLPFHTPWRSISFLFALPLRVFSSHPFLLSFLMKPSQTDGTGKVWSQMDQKTLFYLTHLVHNMLPVRAPRMGSIVKCARVAPHCAVSSGFDVSSCNVVVIHNRLVFRRAMAEREVEQEHGLWCIKMPHSPLQPPPFTNQHPHPQLAT